VWTPAVQLALALGVIISVARTLARASQWIGQPAVTGEIIAGILLGPSLLGAVAPAVSAVLFPPSVIPLLAAHAQIGVVLYMFLVGMELSAEMLALRGREALIISLAGTVVPIALGVLLAAILADAYAPRGVPFPIFASFIGLSLSVTALAVLARILRDWRQASTSLGALALTSAALSDATALSLLAVLAGFARASAGAGFAKALLAVAFIAAMAVVVGPSLSRLAQVARNVAQPSRLTAPVVFAGLFVSAWVADWVGIEAIIGAFVFGAILPRPAHLSLAVTRWLDRAVTVCFLPAFFALTGLRTEIGLLTDARAWLVCAAIIVVASVGKVGSTWVVSRRLGLCSRDALALGVLMNTRGLVELVVLNVGLDLGILTPALFTMLVVMALVTTFATPPVWRLVTTGPRGDERTGR
jgi:Kef-type K+ transport system membrane component KefB